MTSDPRFDVPWINPDDLPTSPGARMRARRESLKAWMREVDRAHDASERSFPLVDGAGSSQVGTGDERDDATGAHRGDTAPEIERRSRRLEHEDVALYYQLAGLERTTARLRKKFSARSQAVEHRLDTIEGLLAEILRRLPAPNGDAPASAD